MPTESRVPAEPTVEELSAYLDHELDAAAQARVADHVAGCAECRTRLDGLRQTAYAIRALPMETPRRTFTIPAQRRQSFRWAPVGWLGGTAAGLLVVVFGVTQLHFHGPAGSPASPSTVSGGFSQGAPYGPVAPLNQPAQDGVSAQRASATNSKSVVDPQNSSRSVTVSTDATSYPASGVITLHVTVKGLSASEASSVRLFLTRDTSGGGYSVRLLPPSKESTFPFDYDAAYSISQMQLPAPAAGNYTLQVAIDTSDRYGLVAWLPLTITP